MKPKPKKNDLFAGGGKGIIYFMGYACMNPKGDIEFAADTLARTVDALSILSEFNSWKRIQQGYRIVRVRVEVV